MALREFPISVAFIFLDCVWRRSPGSTTSGISHIMYDFISLLGGVALRTRVNMDFLSFCNSVSDLRTSIFPSEYTGYESVDEYDSWPGRCSISAHSCSVSFCIVEPDILSFPSRREAPRARQGGILERSSPSTEKSPSCRRFGYCSHARICR